MDNNISVIVAFIIIISVIIWLILISNVEIKNPIMLHSAKELQFLTSESKNLTSESTSESKKKINTLVLSNSQNTDKLILGAYLSDSYHFDDSKAIVVYGPNPKNLLYWSGGGYSNSKSCTNIVGCTNVDDFVLIMTASKEGFELVRKEMKKSHQCLTTDPAEKATYYHLVPTSNNFNVGSILLKFIFREKISNVTYYSRVYDLHQKYPDKLLPEVFARSSEKTIISEELHHDSMRKAIEKYLKVYRTIKVYPKDEYHADILEYTSDNIKLPANKKLFITAIDHCSTKKSYFSCVHIIDTKTNKILNTWITGDSKKSLKIKNQGLYTHLLQTSINQEFKVVEQIYMDPERNDGFHPNTLDILPMVLFITNKEK
jgi:hypothetical protein